MCVPHEKLVRAHVQYTVFYLVIGGVLVWGSTAVCRNGWMLGLLGASVVAVSVAGAFRTSRVEVTASAEAIDVRNRWRTLSTPWDDVASTTWIVVPNMGALSLEFRLVALRSRGTRWPIVVWASDRYLARQAERSVDALLIAMTAAAEGKGIRVRTRVPDWPLYSVTLCWFAVTAAVTTGITIFVETFFTC